MNDSRKNIEEPIKELYQETSNIAAYHQLDEWSKKMAVTPEELKKAIEKAGLDPKTADAIFKKGIKNSE
jgi:hypothetical protein